MENKWKLRLKMDSRSHTGGFDSIVHRYLKIVPYIVQSDVCFCAIDNGRLRLRIKKCNISTEIKFMKQNASKNIKFVMRIFVLSKINNLPIH